MTPDLGTGRKPWERNKIVVGERRFGEDGISPNSPKLALRSAVVRSVTFTELNDTRYTQTTRYASSYCMKLEISSV